MLVSQEIECSPPKRRPLLTFINSAIWTVAKLLMIFLQCCAVLMQQSCRLYIIKCRSSQRWLCGDAFCSPCVPLGQLSLQNPSSQSCFYCARSAGGRCDTWFVKFTFPKANEIGGPNVMPCLSALCIAALLRRGWSSSFNVCVNFKV